MIVEEDALSELRVLLFHSANIYTAKRGEGEEEEGDEE